MILDLQSQSEPLLDPLAVVMIVVRDMVVVVDVMDESHV